MANKVEVTYNPQLGYLKTVFTHPFDFLTEIQSYSQEQNALELVAGTYQKKTARVRVDLLTETAFRFRMYPYEEKVFENAVFPLEGRQAYSLEDKGECLSLSTGRMELRLQKRPGSSPCCWTASPHPRERVRLQRGQHVQVPSHWFRLRWAGQRGEGAGDHVHVLGRKLLRLRREVHRL